MSQLALPDGRASDTNNPNMSTAIKDRLFEYVQYVWRDDEASQLSGVDRLVYRSNKLGEDLTLTNTGGGNTSSKLMERDPLTQSEVEVLWVKGSGGDLRTAKRDGFASFYLDKIRAMKPIYLNHPERGPKTEIEDAMYPMYSHCVYNLNPRAGLGCRRSGYTSDTSRLQSPSSARARGGLDR